MTQQTYQDEGNRCARTLYHYDPTSPIFYDEGRNVAMRSFRCTFLLARMCPACTDCGRVIQEGYCSTDGDNSVVYCHDCIYEIKEAYIMCDDYHCARLATYYRKGEGLHFCENHKLAGDIPFLQ